MRTLVVQLAIDHLPEVYSTIASHTYKIADVNARVIFRTNIKPGGTFELDLEKKKEGLVVRSRMFTYIHILSAEGFARWLSVKSII